jgi:hypothetical protein
MAKRPKVNVCEVLQWECPCCGKWNNGEGWLLSGDTVTCDICKQKCVVEDQICPCRPSKWEGKKAVT